jgi:hypothetical protein
VKFTKESTNQSVSKQLFDKVQEVMKLKSRPRHKDKSEPQAYCGLLSCASCGMMITGEYRIKTQKNGTQHFYTYYHCTKKRRDMKCLEPCIRQESLDAQIIITYKKFLCHKTGRRLLKMKDLKKTNGICPVCFCFCEKNEKRIKDITVKLERLLEGYLDQDIDKETYREEKAKLLSEKKSLEEEIS